MLCLVHNVHVCKHVSLEAWKSKHSFKSPNQSWFKAAHSQKQPITGVLKSASTAGPFSVLILTDITAAFGILNNKIFLSVLALMDISMALVSILHHQWLLTSDVERSTLCGLTHRCPKRFTCGIPLFLPVHRITWWCNYVTWCSIHMHIFFLSPPQAFYPRRGLFF